MFDIFLDRIGDVAVLQPDGRFVQADAVFALRYAVTSLRECPRDCSRSVRSGGLGGRRSGHVGLPVPMEL
jgi:hypothetical protein